MGISGAEDLRLGMKKYVKSDVPPRDAAMYTHQLDRRKFLPSFVGVRRGGSNKQTQESPDMIHCLHPSGTSLGSISARGLEPRVARPAKPAKVLKDPLRNYRDQESCSASVTSSRRGN